MSGLVRIFALKQFVVASFANRDAQ